MRIADSLRETLSAVAAAMAGARHSWWIIGSAAAVLHGAEPITVADVDVLLSVEDAEHIFPAIGLEVLSGSDHPNFKSAAFGTWQKPPIPVDFMAGFHVRDGDRWLPVQPATRQRVDIDGTIVYVPERDELRRIIESFGRPKDFQRARLLAALEK